MGNFCLRRERNNNETMNIVWQGPNSDCETPIYRHNIFNNPERGDQLYLNPSPQIKTLQDLWLSKIRDIPEGEFLGSRKILPDGKRDPEFTWMKNADLFETATNLGKGMYALDLVPEIREYKDYNLRMVAIYSKNSPEWITIDAACIFYGVTSVPIYDTLGEEATKFMFAQTNLTTLFLTTPHLKGIVDLIKSNKHAALRNLVIIDEENMDVEMTYLLTDMNSMHRDPINSFTFSEVLNAGKKFQMSFLPEVKPDDVYTFCYTSGTTGEPKGAMVTHKNMLSSSTPPTFYPRKEGDKQKKGEVETYYLSYLPLAHIMERNNLHRTVSDGNGHYGMFSGDI